MSHRTEGNAIVLFEFGRKLLEPDEWHEHPIAKFKYIQSRNRWRLYGMDSPLKWLSYHRLSETASFQELFREVDTDPSCCFWG